MKGIIRIDYGTYMQLNSLRCIYYGEPLDENQIPKLISDEHS
jgi:hypothetical protein